jgi:hypothetical protein
MYGSEVEAFEANQLFVIFSKSNTKERLMMAREPTMPSSVTTLP